VGLCPVNYIISYLHRTLVLLGVFGLFACDTSPPQDTPAPLKASPELFSVGGSVFGLQGRITLQNNLSETITVSNNGRFVFESALLDNASYKVSILSMPEEQRCTITGNEGKIAAADVSNIIIICNTIVSETGYTIGGTVSGLSGTLILQINDSNPVSINNNGPYQFVENFPDGALYNITVARQPVNQICSVSNISGLIAGQNINNVDVFCSSANVRVSLSGSFTSAPFTQIDSDINDPMSKINVSNNGVLTAQRIPNFSFVQGFATATGTGRRGDRFAFEPDLIDIYRVTLQKNQLIQLQVVNFAGTGIFFGDLDLELYDLDLNFIAESGSTSEFEQIVVPADGEYYILVYAYIGTSKYILSLNGISGLTAERQRSMDFRVGEAVVQFKPTAEINRFKVTNSALHLSHEETTRAVRVSFDVTPLNKTSTPSPGTENFIQTLARQNPADFQKRQTLLQIKRLALRNDIVFAEPNYLYQTLQVPNDEYYDLQWHFPAINLPQAWDITTGTRNISDVIVAVIDTGVFLGHPEFAGQLVAGYDFISNPQNAGDGNGIDANPDDPGDNIQLNSSSWHGTHVAGTIAAKSNNGTGVAGVAWAAKIMPLRVMGTQGGDSYDILQAVRYAAGLSNDSGTVPVQKADVINLSIGGPGFSRSAQETYTAVRDAGVLVVAAAGNDNTAQLGYPASYDGVIAVSATDFANNRAPYSNYGTRIDVAAPGGNTLVDFNADNYKDGILSTLVDDSTGIRSATFDFYQGTSMAAPHVAGVLALMRAIYPALSPDEVDNLLAAGAMTTDLGPVGRDDMFGFGLIDALKSVQAAQQLVNGGAISVQPALIVSKPAQLTLGLADSAVIRLSNVGGDVASVTGISSSANWLNVTPENPDVNGLGDYRISVDRSGLNDAAYSGSISFALSTGNIVQVQVSMYVGIVDNSGNVGSLYILLQDKNNNVVQQVLPVEQGNGVFSYVFSDVSPGTYRIVGGSDIDNDIRICQLGEICGGYPTLENLSRINVSNVDISGLDFLVDILANFGAGTLSAGAGVSALAETVKRQAIPP